MKRRSSSDLPRTIPVFPLPGALLLPRARLPLHIFEPRYLAMVEDVLKSPGRIIGMVQPVSGGDETPDLHDVGCAGRVTTFAETEDGRYMITLTGVSRFRVMGEVEGFTPYRRVDASWHEFERDLGGAERDEGLNRARFMALLQSYFDSQELQTDWESIRDAENEMLVNSLSMLCPFDPEDKQALLEAVSLRDRRETLTTLMEFALHSNGSDERLQ